jgi:hypothetical protein
MIGFLAFAGACFGGVLINALLRWCDGKHPFEIDDEKPVSPPPALSEKERA